MVATFSQKLIYKVGGFVGINEKRTFDNRLHLRLVFYEGITYKWLFNDITGFCTWLI